MPAFVTHALVLEPTTERTSVRARGCTVVLLVGYLLTATMAGVPGSPLTVLLPAGARAPGWAPALASALGLDTLGRPIQIGLAVGVVALLGIAFAGLAFEAWSGRVSVRLMALAAGAALALGVAAPLLLSRDVYSYADAGRIVVVHHQNPYAVTIGSSPADPFVAATSVQWLRHPTVYGPVFTLVSATIVRLGAGSPSTVILAFKALAAIAVATAAGCSWGLARVLRPQRAAFAVAVVALNPVVVIHTVGGGHVDALLGALLACAAFLAFGVAAPRVPRALGVTTCLTLACLVKVVFLPLLALWLWQHLRSTRERRRARLASAHGAVVVGLSGAALAPFAAGWGTFGPLIAVGGLEWWASPVHLVAHLAARVAGPAAAGTVNLVVVGGFLAAALVLVIRTTRRSPASVDSWGATLLVLALALPFLLPWYACWFLPFVAVLDDDVLAGVGVSASLLLGLTLVPADPFHGLTTPGVMAFVHYIVGPMMLGLLTLTAARTWRIGGNGRPPPANPRTR